jgi:protein tyrosine/serine phosphatase
MALRLSWVLAGELAVGTAPWLAEDLAELEREGVSAVLSLCREQEGPLAVELGRVFAWRRVPLPDHRGPEPLTPAHLERALETLAVLRVHGPVYVHCAAGVERSPLVAMAWLMRQRGLGRLQALEYLMQTHPGTSPLPEHLALLGPEPRSWAVPLSA